MSKSAAQHVPLIRTVKGKLLADPSVPQARATIFKGFKAAAVGVFGQDGVAEIRERMSEPCRAACIDEPVGHDFLPESFVMEWYESAYEGPAQRSLSGFLDFIRFMMDHGFGRVRRFLLSLANPSVLVTRAAELWEHDHNTGILTCSSGDAGRVIVTLEDHVYMTSDLGQQAIAEIYCYAFNLCRVKSPFKKTFEVQEDRLIVTLLPS